MKRDRFVDSLSGVELRDGDSGTGGVEVEEFGWGWEVGR